jgi:UDPglucose 6-dehydrogenase
MNDYQKSRFANTIISRMFNTVSGKKIVLYGWAFKKDTNDTRESPAIYVADALLEEQAELCVYDPKVPAEAIYRDLDALGTRSQEENRRLVSVSDDPVGMTDGAHAIAVLTEWDEFRTYNWKDIHARMQRPAFVFDGRRLLTGLDLEEMGFTYYKLGEA